MPLTRNERVALNKKQDKVIVSDGAPVDTDLTEGLPQIRKTSEGLVEYVKSDNVVYKKVLDEGGKAKRKAEPQPKLEKSILEDNLDDTGYIKFDNGLIIQWGSKTWTGTETTHTLDPAFPNNFFFVTGDIMDGSYGTIHYVWKTGLDTINFRKNNASSRTTGWIAIGN
jgi:hypothetical protein|tara:strand:- start:1183 stop:1686 length:504 start_codon:yes stop_codon:yes gene_type:complete